MKKAFIASSNIVSPLGFTTDDNFNAVLAGKSGLQNHDLGFANHEFCVSIIPTESLENQFQRICFNDEKYTKLEKMSIVSIVDAIKKTNLTLTGSDTLLIYCSTKGNIDLLAQQSAHNLVPEGVELHQLAHKIADFFGFQNTPLVVSNACISSLQGLLIARRFIESGMYKNVIVSGGDLVSKFTLSGFKSFNALSDSICKPFDLNRKGINIGEAVATIILTDNEENSEEKIEVIAGYTTNDANHISAPSRTGEGLYQAIQKTLAHTKNKVDFVSAHGTGTIYNDEMESHAFHRSGLSETPMNSLKGHFGHTLGASGLLESIIAMRSVQQGELIPSVGYEACGTPFELSLIQKREQKNMTQFLKTSSGFGGCNAAVLFSKL